MIDIKGYDGMYSIYEDGMVWSYKTNTFLKHLDNGKGYYQVTLRKNNKEKKCYIHRLLAIHFIDNKDDKPFVNHIDGNKKNNSIDNLEWVTAKENTSHAFKIGLMSKNQGELHYRSKLNPYKVRVIRKLLENSNMTLKQIGVFFGVNLYAISKIKRGVNWKHVQ